MDLSQYYAEICKEPFLSKDEEVALFTKYNDPETTEEEKSKIKDRIIKANLRFAFKQAKNYSRYEPSLFAELISAANEGLMVGFEKYDFNRDIKFLSYAGWWVLQRILDEMANMRIVSLPKWKQQLASKIIKSMDTNEQVTLEELKREFVKPGISEKDVEEMYNTRYLTYYIDDLEETNFEIDPIGEEVQKKIDETKVWKLVSELESPYREILAKSFGLEDGIEYPPAKLAKILRMKKEDVAKYKAEGLLQLKQKMYLTN